MRRRINIAILSSVAVLIALGLFFAGIAIGEFRAAFVASQFQVVTLSIVLDQMEEKASLNDGTTGRTERSIRSLLMGSIAYLSHHERSFFVKDIISRRTDTLSKYLKQGESEFSKTTGYDFDAWRNRKTSESALDKERSLTIKAVNEAVDEFFPGRADLKK